MNWDISRCCAGASERFDIFILRFTYFGRSLSTQNSAKSFQKCSACTSGERTNERHKDSARPGGEEEAISSASSNLEKGRTVGGIVWEKSDKSDKSKYRKSCRARAYPPLQNTPPSLPLASLYAPNHPTTPAPWHVCRRWRPTRVGGYAFSSKA